jgi:Ca2+-transporting ATPase
MAEQGLRVLALAEKAADTTEVNPYEHLTLIGLVGMVDPPRQGVREAVGLCRDAGIRAVMVTGDQPKTAYSIASQIGLIEKDQERVIAGTDVRAPEELSEEDRKRFLQASIFARVSPKQKLDLIDLHQQAGSVVAMTGDGVNDAPALKKADIGVAMGQRGTQVAREAADMVLKDDAFSTILVAVEQGRIIFNNIRKFVLYLLSCNVSEVMIVFLASLVNAPLPILPLQILFLNLVTDVFPALALGVGEGDPAIMRQKPRDPKEPILTSRHWLAIIVYGLLITVSVLCSFALAFILLAMDSTQAVTISFLTLAFAQLWHIFNMRQTRSRFLRNEIVRNRFIWGAIALCTALLIASVYVPVLSTVLGLINPGFKGWILVILMSLIPCVAGQIFKAINEETKKTEEGRSPS